MIEKVEEPDEDYIKKEWEKFEMNTKKKEQKIKNLMEQIERIDTCLSIYQSHTNTLEEERDNNEDIDEKIMDVINADNRFLLSKKKCVKAYYHVEEKFKIPKNINLEDKNVSWFVKYNTLFINKDNKEISIEPSWNSPDSFDFKYTDEEEIEEDESDSESEEETETDSEEED